MWTALLVNWKSLWNFGPILPQKQGSSSAVVQRLFIAVPYNQTKTKSTQTTINAWTQAPWHAFGCSITKQMSLMSHCVYSNRKLLCKLQVAFDPEYNCFIRQCNPRCTYRTLKVFICSQITLSPLTLLYCFVFQHIRCYGIFLSFCPSSISFPATTNPSGTASSLVTARKDSFNLASCWILDSPLRER